MSLHLPPRPVIEPRVMMTLGALVALAAASLAFAALSLDWVA